MTEREGLGRLLPPEVEVHQTTVDAPESALLPEELASVASAVPKRRAEFATVRDCARRALARLGHPPVPIVPGADREPQWPVGIVGSLTHCDGYRAAAVASAADLASLGIDAEPNEPLPEGVAPLVTIGDELRMLDGLSSISGVRWDRLLFSAKESIYKTWFPVARRWLDFTECELSIDVDAGTFTGRLLVPGPVLGGNEIQEFTGRWVLQRQHLVTAVHLPAAGRSSVSQRCADVRARSWSRVKPSQSMGRDGRF